MSRKIEILIVFILICLSGTASRCFSAPALSGVEMRLKDTLQVKGSGSVTNTISLKNLGGERQHLEFVIDEIAGWRPIGKSVIEFDLEPFATKVIPVSLAQTSRIQPLLTAVHFVIRNRYKAKAQGGTFYLRVPPVARFDLSIAGSSEVIFTAPRQEHEIRFRVSNQGNREMRYKAKLAAQTYGIDANMIFFLAPQKDTIISFSFSGRGRTRKSGLFKELFEVAVSDDSMRQQQTTFDIINTSKTVKVNSSSYRHFPLRIELGGYSRTESKYFYGQASGEVALGDKWMLNFMYRTEDYTDANVNQPNLFSVQLQGPRLGMYVGPVSRQTEFFTFGTEASIGIRLGKSGRAVAFGMKPIQSNLYSGYYSNREQLGTELGYRLGKLQFTTSAIATLDSVRNPASAIVTNKFTLLESKKLRLSGAFGVGLDSVSKYFSRNGLSENLGYSYSGNFGYSLSRVSLFLSGSARSMLFPGVSKGATSAAATLQYEVSKKVTLSPYYTTNRVANNFGIDTLLNTNRIAFNNSRAGLMSMYMTNKTKVSVGVGLFKDATQIDLPNYHALDVTYNYGSDKSSLQLDSRSGLSSVADSFGSRSWFSSTSLNFVSPHFFVFGNYYRYPSAGQYDATESPAFSETLSLMCGGQYTLFKRLSLRGDYTISRYSTNKTITHNVRGVANYRTRDGKFQANLNASIPVFQQKGAVDNAAYLAGRNYVQFSLVRNFNVPMPGKKKFVSLKMAMFKDENGNGKKDGDESSLNAGRVLVNGFPVLVGSHGESRVMHSPRGVYSVNLSQLDVPGGYIPSNGYTLDVDLQRDQRLNIPFAKGKMLQGSVVLISDGEVKDFQVEGLKIIVSDSSRTIAFAMVNNVGEFKLALPAGKYKVSLNEEAFGDKYRPVQVSFPIDLVQNETGFVKFEIKQKKREMRFSQTVTQKISVDTAKRPNNLVPNAKSADRNPKVPTFSDKSDGRKAPQAIPEVSQQPAGEALNTKTIPVARTPYSAPGRRYRTTLRPKPVKQCKPVLSVPASGH